MNIITKCLDKLKNNRNCQNLTEELALNLLKEYPTQLEPSQIQQITIALTELSAADKVSAVYAVVSLLEMKFKENHDENYYLNVSNELIQLCLTILNFFVMKTHSFSFNTQDELFSKTVESGLTLFIPLRKKSPDLGSAFMKTCSPLILTLLTCKRLPFSIRQEATILYAQEVSQCDRNILTKITRTQHSLMSKLVQWIPECGDIQLQEALIEIAVYISASSPEKTSVIKKWFLNSEFDPAVESLSYSNLSTSTRVCLNYINSMTKPKKVFTLACQKCFGDNYTLIYKPKDEEYKELWVDFNTSTKCINLIYTPDLDQKGWKRLLLYFDNIKSLECCPSNSLIRKEVDEYQLRFAFKKSVDVTTRGQHYEFSGLTLIFIEESLLKELVNEFLIFHFPNLDTYSTNMKSFKTPEPVRQRKDIKIPKSIISGSKDYFSRKSSELETPSRSSCLANSNEYFLKYKNITPNDKSQFSVDGLEKSMCANTNDEYKGKNRPGNSFIKSKTNSVTSNSSSFITDYAKVTSNFSGNLKKNVSSLNCSWKSNSSSLFRGFSDSSFQIRQEGGGKERAYESTSDKENLDRNITITSMNGLDCEKIDTCIVRDPSTDDDDDDEDIPVLRSAPAREASPINISHTSLSKNIKENTSSCNIGNASFQKININNEKLETVHNNSLPLVLGEKSDDSNSSDIFSQKPDFTTVRRFSEEFETVPIPDYESDDSIIEDSQPKETGIILIPRRSCESFKSGSDKLLSDKTTPTHSSPLSKSEEEYFVTNKNKRFSNFSNQSMLRSISDSSQIDFPTNGNNLKDLSKTSLVQRCQNDLVASKFDFKHSTKCNQTIPSDSTVLAKLKSKAFDEISSTLKDSYYKTNSDVLKCTSKSRGESAKEFPCQNVLSDLTVLSNKTSRFQTRRNMSDDSFKQGPKVIKKSSLKPSSSRLNPSKREEVNDVITVEDNSPIRNYSEASVSDVDLRHNTAFNFKDFQKERTSSTSKVTDVIKNTQRSGMRNKHSESSQTSGQIPKHFDRVAKGAGMFPSHNKLITPSEISMDLKLDKIHPPLNKVKEVKLNKYTSSVEPEKLSIRESESNPRHVQVYSKETQIEAKKSVNNKEKFRRKDSVESSKINVPSIETEVTSPKNSQFIQSQHSAFKPAIPMSKPVSDAEICHLKKGRAERVLVTDNLLTMSEDNCNKLNIVHEVNKKSSVSPGLLFTNSARKKSEKRSNVKFKELTENPSRINPTQLNASVQENKICSKRFTRPVVKVEESGCSKLDDQSRSSLPANSLTFRPISRGTQCSSRVESSMRSTDASSKMELEQIFHHCYEAKSAVINEKSLIPQEKRKPTPFVKQASSSFINKAVKVVQDLCPVNSILPNPSISESSAALVNKSDISNYDRLEANKKNETDTVASRHDSSRLTVPASSGSDSSLFMSPYEEGSNHLNFTRFANTDANNNTLVDKKSLLKECSPAVLPMTRPTKTYMRKQVKKPNHAWFQTENKKIKSNKTSVVRPIKKKKLFYLPSNYQQSPSSDDCTSVKVSGLQNEPKKIIKKDVKKANSILYDIKELDECSETETGAPEIKEVMEDVINSNSSIRRSTRNRRRINYKEISDTETEKSQASKNNVPTSSPSEKTLIKQIILNSTDKKPTESCPTSLSAKRRKIINNNSHGEHIATENHTQKNILKKSDKSHRNKTTPAESESDQIDLNLETEPNRKYTPEIANDIRSSKPISKLTAADDFLEKACVHLDSSIKKTNEDSHKDIFDFDEAAETSELREIPFSKKNYLLNRQRQLKMNNTEMSKIQFTGNDIEVYDDNKTPSSNLKRASQYSSKTQLKKIKTQEDLLLADKADDTKSGKTSPTDSLWMETIKVDAMIHHPGPHDLTVKSRLKRGTTAEIQLENKEDIENCDAVEEDSTSTSLQHGSKELLSVQSPTLFSLMNSIKEHIDHLNCDFNKLVEVFNPVK